MAAKTPIPRQLPNTLRTENPVGKSWKGWKEIEERTEKNTVYLYCRDGVTILGIFYSH